MLVYLLNVLDRQILSILNERVKADLALSDAQMGFLFGTAFAVFHAVLGLPLARLADVWVRRSLIAAGLAFWSLMTALSGLATGFGQLAALRIAMGIGEATSTPASYSLLSDTFPPRRRATAIAVFASGALLGGGAGMIVGGSVVGWWDARAAEGAAPFGLAGWRAAFLLVGLPGLLFLELRAVVPPFTLLHLLRTGAGARGLARNLASAGLYFFSALWIGVGPTVIQELVLPRVRATTASFYGIVFTFMGYALGPYVVGKLSDATGDLRTALAWTLCAAAGAVLSLAVAMRHVARDEATLLARARAAGESIIRS